VDSPFFFPPIGRVFSECEVWRGKAIERISAIQPDIVIIGSAQYQFSSDELRSGTERVLTKLSTSSRLVLVMNDTPRLESDPVNCLARSSWRLGFFPKTDCNPALITESRHRDVLPEVLVGSFPNVLMVDMNPFICDEANCKAVKDGIFVFRDDNHISNTFAKRLASDFTRQIESRSQILSTVGAPETPATR
jgi:hypothetical protein